MEPLAFQELKPGVPRFGASGLPGREFPVHLSGEARPAARAAGPPIPEEGCPEIGGANSRKRIALSSGIVAFGGAAARLFGRPSGGPGPRRAARMSPTANFPPRPPARAIPDGLSRRRGPPPRRSMARAAERSPSGSAPPEPRIPGAHGPRSDSFEALKNSPEALPCLRYFLRFCAP